MQREVGEKLTIKDLPDHQYKTLRVIAILRDRYQCVKCGMPLTFDDAQVHHIKPLKDGGKNEIENLETLCLHCHHKAHRQDFKNWSGYVKVKA